MNLRRAIPVVRLLCKRMHKQQLDSIHATESHATTLSMEGFCRIYSKDFVSDLVTLMFNMRIFVVVEQPGTSQFFKYPPIAASCLHWIVLPSIDSHGKRRFRP